MTLGEKLAFARKKKGFTQDELATTINVTVRTIQRVESGESVPRTFTLKAMAAALEMPFEDLVAPGASPAVVHTPVARSIAYNTNELRHFLQMHGLSCFSYLVIPYIHFLIPRYLLKKNNHQPLVVLNFARKTIMEQVYWVIAINILLLVTLAINLVSTYVFNTGFLLSYSGMFFIMYLLNAFLICLRLVKANRLVNKIEIGA